MVLGSCSYKICRDSWNISHNIPLAAALDKLHNGKQLVALDIRTGIHTDRTGTHTDRTDTHRQDRYTQTGLVLTQTEQIHTDKTGTPRQDRYTQTGRILTDRTGSHGKYRHTRSVKVYKDITGT